ncbi:VanW family protein [Nocardioides marinus]|uniref:Vancomycin resistance protein YoaR n=1 Tax=Nocardioides marinus TaxID=374514 RepID=A0A7Z0C4A0_9ACTN|nr:VanW family protein [Nocardioides marinus]NYI11092.1 vancomycin resistance protein YoaR [Nocardioides marinus]
MAKDSGREALGGRAVVVAVATVALLLGGGYAAAGAFASDRVPRGTTVGGVAVGGQTPAEAKQTLARAWRDRVDAPITVTVDGESTTVAPSEAGLEPALDATVEAAGAGDSWAPGRLWDYWTGGDEVAPVVTVDEQRMQATVQRLDGELGTAPVDGTVSFTGSTVRTTKATTGRVLDDEAVREALVAAYLSEEPSAELELVEVEPDITDADVEQAVEDYANPALSGPVTLVFGDTPVKLRPSDYAKALSLDADGGVLTLATDIDVVMDLVDQSTVQGEPVDATVRIVDGEPEVVPAKPGVSFADADVYTLFIDLLTQPEGERRGEVDATVVEPEVTTKDVRQLGIKEQVSTFTTYYPHAEYRNTNIGRAAELTNGTLLLPGETFSMNDIVGERTRENGFTEGFIISNGILREDLGGGVSQLATTLFNAMFFAGLEDVEHKPHSFYIDRYPVGREATVAWGALDLRFRNNTEHGVFVQSYIRPSTPSSQGSVTVSLYSTKVWDIEARASNRYAYTEPEVRYLQTDDCYAYTGSSGFQIDVFRDFRRPGKDKVVRTEKFHTVYTPSDSVRCGKPPEDGEGGQGG